jgi:hypothetical protein
MIRRTLVYELLKQIINKHEGRREGRKEEETDG